MSFSSASGPSRRRAKSPSDSSTPPSGVPGAKSSPRMRTLPRRESSRERKNACGVSGSRCSLPPEKMNRFLARSDDRASRSSAPSSFTSSRECGLLVRNPFGPHSIWKPSSRMVRIFPPGTFSASNRMISTDLPAAVNSRMREWAVHRPELPAPTKAIRFTPPPFPSSLPGGRYGDVPEGPDERRRVVERRHPEKRGDPGLPGRFLETNVQFVERLDMVRDKGQRDDHEPLDSFPPEARDFF